MSDWLVRSLGDVAAITRNSVAPEDIRPELPYLGLDSIESGGRICNVRTAGDAGIESQKFKFTSSQVLFGKLRPYLAKIARPDFGGVCSTDILPITPGPTLDRNYLAHFLAQPSMVELATTRSTGANLPRLSPAELGKFSIPMPSLGEQRRIAEVLDRVDVLREKRRQAVALLDDLAQSIFLGMFGDPALAKGWPTVPLGQLAEVQGGIQVTSKRKSLSMEVPYLRVANVYRGYLALEEIKKIRVTETELDRTRLKVGDLLVVEGHGNPAEIGRVARWDGSIESCTHQNHLIRVRVTSADVTSEYMEAYLNSDVGRRHLIRSANTTSGLNTISTSDVRAAPTLVPPLVDQVSYGSRIDRLAEARRSHEAHLAELDSLFAALQSRAFRGEL